MVHASSLRRGAAAATLSPFLLLTLPAQTPISGALSGTLAAGVYHVTGGISVAAGQTLTLPEGVIFKFTNGGLQFTIDGTLVANGTAANPVVFTDIRDDSAGGDTNGDGPSVGAPTAWRGIVFNGTAGASALHHADVRYGGSGFVSNLHLVGCNPTFADCVVRDCYTHGLFCGGSSLPVVTGCTFTGNGGNAIEGVVLANLASWSGNTASGNGGNFARVTTAGVTTSLALDASCQIGGAITIDAGVVVNAGATLTLGPGMVVKLMNGGDQVTIDGTLLANGTAASPVVFTDFRDDSAGGDTNGDGPSSGAPTGWRGIVFTSGASASVLTHTDVRYGGSGFVSNLHLIGANPRLVDCVVRDCYTHGLNCNGNSFPTVTGCTFADNGGNAAEAVPLAGLANWTGNSATGNGRNIARVTTASLTASLALDATCQLGGAIAVDTGVAVAAGTTLTLGPGIVVKLMNGGDQVTIDGTLLANGTAAAPVVFTDFRDDSAGGDTNNDGPSVGQSAAWRGIVFTAGSAASVLEHADIRYAGNGFVSNVHLVAANPTFRNSVVRDCYTHGMNLNGNSFPIVEDCTFTGNGGNAVEAAPFTALPGFRTNTASGNVGNFLRVTTASVAAPTTVGPESVLGSAIVMADNLNVVSGATLTIEQGVVLKFTNAYQVVVDGAMNLLGTAYEPVVFTELRDDEFGGDTAGDGATVGQPGAWRGVYYQAGATASLVEHARIRYAGSGFVPGLTCSSHAVTIRSLRVDRAYDRGLVLDDTAGTVANAIVWGCGGIGVHLVAGDHLLTHATVDGCGSGIRRETAWTGSVVNAIVWANATNFVGFGAGGGGQVLFCDGGFAGSNGNLDVDPQFVAPGNGDLHLQATSPCLGVADLLQAFVALEDHDENSRILDHALVGVPLPDMGAYEFCQWDMTVTGTSQPGSVFTYTVTGPAADSFYFLGFLDGQVPVIPYGWYLAGGWGLLVSPTPVPVNSPLLLPVPNDVGLAGVRVAIATLTFANGTIATGNFTRLHRILLRR